MAATTRDNGVPPRDTAESGGALLGGAGCGWGFEVALHRERPGNRPFGEW